EILETPRRGLIDRTPADMVVTTSSSSIAPLRGGADALQVFEDQRAPRFHPIEDRTRLRRLGERAAELVGFADRDRAARGLRDVHRADVDAPDVGRVVVQQPDEPELRLERGVDLLAPLPAQAAGEIAVAGIQVAADADRVAVVKAGVPTGLRAAHQEVPLAVE